MHNASDGARIKVWPNAPSAMSGDLQGGGGSGRVKNVTYGTFSDLSLCSLPTTELSLA